MKRTPDPPTPVQQWLSRRAAAFGVGALAALLFSGCPRKAETETAAAKDTIAAAEAPAGGEELYQCSMHPNIVSDQPGTCPICAMDLQPVKKIDAPGIPGRAPVELTALQRQLINVRVARVAKQDASIEVRAVGVVTYDATRVAEVNARIMGWVETLHVDKPGQPVRVGELLMAVYSPQLYSAQREYLLAWQSANRDAPDEAGRPSEQLQTYLAASRESARTLLDAGRRRLELWGIGEAQIQRLQETGEPTDTMELLAPVTGVVVEKHVLPKQMVQPGMKLYQLADLSRVWLEVEVYEYELPLIKVGQPVTVTVSAYPSDTFNGTVDFIYPYLQPKTRTTKVRLVLDNPELRLRPDMYASAVSRHELGDQLLVPAAAVFDTGRRQYVFVEQDEGVFVPREITLGPKTGSGFVVQAGLAEGDEVVIDGNFLLDSESQLKAAASGSAPAEAEMTGEPSIVQPMPAETAAAVKELLDAYAAARDALANDTLEGVADAYRRMQSATENLKRAAHVSGPNREQYLETLDILARCFAAPPTSGTDLERARIQFGSISEALIGLFQRFPPPSDQPLHVAFCPMWKASPANWLQRGTEIRNPFMGQAMIACGEITGTIEAR